MLCKVEVGVYIPNLQPCRSPKSAEIEPLCSFSIEASDTRRKLNEHQADTGWTQDIYWMDTSRTRDGHRTDSSRMAVEHRTDTRWTSEGHRIDTIVYGSQRGQWMDTDGKWIDARRRSDGNQRDTEHKI